MRYSGLRCTGQWWQPGLTLLLNLCTTSVFATMTRCPWTHPLECLERAWQTPTGVRSETRSPGTSAKWGPSRSTHSLTGDTSAGIFWAQLELPILHWNLLVTSPLILSFLHAWTLFHEPECLKILPASRLPISPLSFKAILEWGWNGSAIASHWHHKSGLIFLLSQPCIRIPHEFWDCHVAGVSRLGAWASCK